MSQRQLRRLRNNNQLDDLTPFNAEEQLEEEEQEESEGNVEKTVKPFSVADLLLSSSEEEETNEPVKYNNVNDKNSETFTNEYGINAPETVNQIHEVSSFIVFNLENRLLRQSQ